MTAPLRLKSEVAKKRSEISSDLPVAQCWVDTGIFHLDQSFDYAIPDHLSEFVQVGVKVQVPFNGREVEALVIERREDQGLRTLKEISKVLTRNQVATHQSIDLYAQVAKRWASPVWDVIRSAIPPRVVALDTPRLLPFVTPSTGPSQRQYLQLPPFKDRYQLLAELAEEKIKAGGVLIVVPHARALVATSKYLRSPITLGSELSRNERYSNYLEAMRTANRIVIGTRSAIFTPVHNLKSIIILDEGSEQGYEVRSPGWNVRDIALIRNKEESVSTYFVGYSYSSEIARLVDTKWIEFKKVSARLEIEAFTTEFSELLPGRSLTKIRSALKSGPVLFVVRRKGFVSALICSACKNIARCECGGSLIKGSIKGAPFCSLCGKADTDWKCTWCQNKSSLGVGRGSDRIAEEIGRSFPGVRIVRSEGDHIVDNLPSENQIVVATTGSVPIIDGGYQAIVFLNADSYFSHSDLRTMERAREIFFSHSSFLSTKGKVFLIGPHNMPIVGALASWNPQLLMKRELRERGEAHLPPFYRTMVLTVDSHEATVLVRALTSAKADSRLGADISIHGPVAQGGDKAKITIFFSLHDSDQATDFIYQFMKKRSATGKALPSLRVDPYLIG